jgi:putative ABC transport system permease protein
MMLTNYIKITLRNLYKEKMYALINVSGLSLGIACCIILGLFLHSELTYDQHHLKHKRIFRVVTEASRDGILRRSARTTEVLGPLMARDYPEIETYVRFLYLGNTLLRHEDDAFYWENVCFADESVFEVFTHEYIYGDPKMALSDPVSIAVSESFARKYFGDANPIGKTITNNDGFDYKITLVFADLPENTHLKYDVLVLIPSNRVNTSLDDGTVIDKLKMSPRWYTYLLMPEGYQAKSFQGIWESFFNRYIKEITRNDWRKTYLEPLTDIHLKSDLSRDRPKGDKFLVYGLLMVGAFILIVACINYVNLSTARSMKRGREVGVRKVLGATRIQLITQFLGESVFFSLIALVIGIVLVETALTFTPINDLLGKQELIDFFSEPALLLWMLALSLVIGLISGLYPAFYHSSILPISALTGRSHVGKKGFRLRQLLVLVQFIISIGVIAATILMAIQMRFVNNIDLGFNKENRVITNLIGADLIEKVPTLKTELLSDSRILGVSLAYQMPGGEITDQYAGLEIAGYTFPVEGNDGLMERATLNLMQVDEDFIEVIGAKIKLGRDFSKRLSTDVERSCLVNEATVKMMGWVEPLGKRIGESGGYYGGRVVGVVEDFNFRSLHQRVEPLVMYLIRDDFSALSPSTRAVILRQMALNVSGREMAETLNYIEDVFAEFDPTYPFEYELLDHKLDELYSSERRLMTLTGIFSGICIFISCLGLFGLAAFTTEQRTKEIGIRKVLGATTFQIIVMLSRSILLIVLVASIIASVAAYLAIDEWLAGFAYHAGINPLVFVFSAAFAMAVAFGTVALQSFRTAQANPVEALRYE